MIGLSGRVQGKRTGPNVHKFSYFLNYRRLVSLYVFRKFKYLWSDVKGTIGKVLAAVYFRQRNKNEGKRCGLLKHEEIYWTRQLSAIYFVVYDVSDLVFTAVCRWLIFIVLADVILYYSFTFTAAVWNQTRNFRILPLLLIINKIKTVK
jgi:hypothetical protein